MPDFRLARRHLGHLCYSRTELAIRFAVAALMLTLTEPLLMAALEWAAPRWFDAASRIDDTTRRWLFGLGAMIPFLIACTWNDLRMLRGRR